MDPAHGGNDVAAIRELSQAIPHSLYVIRFLGIGSVDIIYQQSFAPAPFTIFLGDITNDGADEMFLLRTLACNPAAAVSGSNPPQLFLRTPVAGSTLSFEVCLDGDNAFKRGASGDLDGDGRTEIVVISRYQMRIFSQPESSTSLFTNVAVASNAVALAVGNLDTNGNATTARLAATVTTIDTTLQAGTQVGPVNVQIYNGSTAESIEFAVTTIPAAPYVTWTVSGSQTNANLAVSLDATALIPGGVYGANLVITARSSHVANSPLVIPVIVRVTGAAINPPRSAVVVYPCNRVPGPLATITQTLTVVGDQASWGKTFSITVEPATAAGVTGVTPQVDWPSNVPWVAASSPTMTVPSTLEIIVDPNQAADDDEALIVLISSLDGNSQLRYTSSLRLICTNHATFVPLIASN